MTNCGDFMQRRVSLNTPSTSASKIALLPWHWPITKRNFMLCWHTRLSPTIVRVIMFTIGLEGHGRLIQDNWFLSHSQCRLANWLHRWTWQFLQWLDRTSWRSVKHCWVKSPVSKQRGNPGHGPESDRDCGGGGGLIFFSWDVTVKRRKYHLVK